jgi:hypothetical protein
MHPVAVNSTSAAVQLLEKLRLRLQRLPAAGRRATKASWSEVLNQYQRRADLIPNIVATVKGEANFEQETLTKVVEARAKATSIQATPELINNPEAFNKFQQAQGELSGASAACWWSPRTTPT